MTAMLKKPLKSQPSGSKTDGKNEGANAEPDPKGNNDDKKEYGKRR